MRPSERLRARLENEITLRSPGQRLPTEAELAGRFGVSVSTASRLIRSLARSGLCTRIPGLGTFVGEGPTVSRPEDASRPVRHSQSTLAEHLHIQIHTGALKARRILPSIKYMVRQYRISPVTVSRAYSQLLKRGDVVRVGKRWVVHGPPRLTGLVSGGTIKVILSRRPSDDPFFGADALGSALLHCERELQANGYRVFWHMPVGAGLSGLTPALPDGATADGVLLYGPRTTHTARRTIAHVKSASRRLHKTIPLVVVGLTGVTRSLAGVPGRITIVNTGNIATVQARTAAAYLADQGYERVVFWSEDTDDAPAFRQYIKLHPEILDIGPHIDVRIVVLSAGNGPDGLLASIDTPEEQRALAVILNKYGSLGFDHFRQHLAAGTGFRRDLIGTTGRCAWVFMTHALARSARQWAVENRVPIPRRLGILSLQDDFSHVDDGITCCVPDWDNAGYQLGRILMGERDVEKSRMGFLKTRAVVLQRST